MIVLAGDAPMRTIRLTKLDILLPRNKKLEVNVFGNALLVSSYDFSMLVERWHGSDILDDAVYFKLATDRFGISEAITPVSINGISYYSIHGVPYLLYLFIHNRYEREGMIEIIRVAIQQLSILGYQ